MMLFRLSTRDSKLHADNAEETVIEATLSSRSVSPVKLHHVVHARVSGHSLPSVTSPSHPSRRIFSCRCTSMALFKQVPSSYILYAVQGRENASYHQVHQNVTALAPLVNCRVSPPMQRTNKQNLIPTSQHIPLLTL